MAQLRLVCINYLGGMPVAHAWMPGARRIRARAGTGGPLEGRIPCVRRVMAWLTPGTTPGAVSVQSAATRLLAEGAPATSSGTHFSGRDRAAHFHPAVPGRAARHRGPRAPAAGARRRDRAPRRHRTHAPAGAAGGIARSAPASVRGAASTDVNTEGRVCVQIGVLGHPADARSTSGSAEGRRGHRS